jgi:hypothetical protein
MPETPNKRNAKYRSTCCLAGRGATLWVKGGASKVHPAVHSTVPVPGRWGRPKDTNNRFPLMNPARSATHQRPPTRLRPAKAGLLADSSVLHYKSRPPNIRNSTRRYQRRTFYGQTINVEPEGSITEGCMGAASTTSL